MSNKDFLKGFGLAVGLAVAAGAAIYVGKKHWNTLQIKTNTTRKTIAAVTAAEQIISMLPSWTMMILDVTEAVMNA